MSDTTLDLNPWPEARSPFQLMIAQLKGRRYPTEKARDEAVSMINWLKYLDQQTGFKTTDPLEASVAVRLAADGPARAKIKGLIEQINTIEATLNNGAKSFGIDEAGGEGEGFAID